MSSRSRNWASRAIKSGAHGHGTPRCEQPQQVRPRSGRSWRRIRAAIFSTGWPPKSPRSSPIAASQPSTGYGLRLTRFAQTTVWFRYEPLTTSPGPQVSSTSEGPPPP